MQGFLDIVPEIHEVLRYRMVVAGPPLILVVPFPIE